MTQNNLGSALEIFGERESGTVRLEEAVAAYRVALEEYAHARVPLDWAARQNNLGVALRTLGERRAKGRGWKRRWQVILLFDRAGSVEPNAG
jgi:hypothetical protein